MLVILNLNHSSRETTPDHPIHVVGREKEVPYAYKSAYREHTREQLERCIIKA